MDRKGKSIRVLHVDDDPEFVELAGTMLERQNDRFAVESITSARKVLDRLDSGDFDCVISDFDLPEQTGLELLEAVRAAYPSLPFILFTGKGSEEIASEAISANVTDYLQKEGGTSQYAVLANRVRNAVEKYHAEAELIDREQRLNLFFEQSPLGVIEWDENFHLNRINDSGEEILGYSQADLRGEDWEAIVPESDRDQVAEVVADLLENKGGYHSINENVRTNGERIICEWHNWVVTDEADDVVAIFSNFQDVTDREERKRELERYEAYLEESTDIVTVLSEDGTIEYQSPSVTRILGYPPGGLVGEDGFEFIHPDDEAAARDTFADVISEPNGTGTIECRFRTANDEWCWLEIRGTNRLGDDPIDGVLTNNRDITDRKEREAELERARDLLGRSERIANVGGWEIDGETNEVFWTENLFDLLGIDDTEEPPLTEALDVYHEDDRHIVASAVEDAIETGESFDVEARFHRPDGELRWLRVKGNPTTSADGGTKVRGAVQDITDRRRRERALRELYDIMSDSSKTFSDQVKAVLELGRDELETQYGTLSKIRGQEYLFEFVAADDDSIQAGDVVPLSATNCEIAARTEQTLVLGDIERDAPAETDRAGFSDFSISCYLGAPVFVDDEVYGTLCFYGTEARTDQFSDWEVTLVDLMSRWLGYELHRRHVPE